MSRMRTGKGGATGEEKPAPRRWASAPVVRHLREKPPESAPARGGPRRGPRRSAPA